MRQTICRAWASPRAADHAMKLRSNLKTLLLVLVAFILLATAAIWTHLRANARLLALWQNHEGSDAYMKSCGEIYFYGYTGHPSIAKIQSTLDSGANINAKNTLGATPLLAASTVGDLDCIRYLVSKGAQVNIEDDDGNCPLLWAALSGNLESVKFLVARGAKVNSKMYLGATPLFMAVTSGNLDCVRFLISNEAPPQTDKL